MFSGITLFTLAIGIGANTAIFSVLHGVLLRSLPYARADRLVGVSMTALGLGIKDAGMSPSTYFLYREESRTLEDVGLFQPGTVSVTGIAEPQEVDALYVTERTLPALGVQPILGHGFTAEDGAPGGPQNVILTYGYWQRRFGGDRSAIGQRILVDGDAKQIIGVLPRDFRFMNFKPAMILTYQFDRAKAFIGNFSYRGVARLKDGVTLTGAAADANRVTAMLPEKFPPAAGMSLKMFEDARIGANVHPLKDDVVGDIGKVLWILMGTVGIVLLIACANVANLMLVRAEGRQQELAIRAALGASRGEIVRELLRESVLLGLIGGVLGVGLAAAGVRLLVAIAPANLPRLDEISIDPPVLLFALAVSLVAGVLFGLLPAWKYGGAGLAGTLRQGGRTSSEGRERHRARSILVVGQVAMALVLLMSAGLMIRTIRALKEVQPGFTEPAHILTVRLSIPDAQAKEPEAAVRLEHAIIERVSALPGVTSASMTTGLNMDGDGWRDPIYAETRPSDNNRLPALRRYKMVAPGSFQTMGNPLLAGRDMTWPEVLDMRPVVLVSENVARELWGSPQAAIGKRVRENPKGVWREVIGVVGNTHDAGLHAPPAPSVYWPILIKNLWDIQVRAERSPALVIRSPRTGSASLLKEVQQAIWSVNPNLTLSGVRTMQEIYDRSLERTSFTLVMLTIAASMALLLGVVGIYGVIAYAVSQRTREIGVRIALGAPHSSVRAMFVGRALVLAGVGLAVGLGAAVALTRLMKGLLYGVGPMDPATMVSVSIILSAAAIAAAYLPARRATRIEPVEALRAD